MATIAGANNNPVARRNVYPQSSGPTIGGAASTLSPYDTAAIGGASGSAAVGANGGTASASAVAAAQAASSRGFLGQPLTWFMLLIVLLVGMRWVGAKIGDAEDFRNIRVTVHNVIIISLAAIIGIGFFKVVFNYWKVPGLTAYINAV
jgi:hypothetical protein